MIFNHAAKAIEMAIPRMGLQSSDSSSHALRAAAGRHTAVAPTNLRIVD